MDLFHFFWSYLCNRLTYIAKELQIFVYIDLQVKNLNKI